MKKAYVFPGQGAQYTGMGKDLYDTNPTAREMFDKADTNLGKLLYHNFLISCVYLLLITSWFLFIFIFCEEKKNLYTMLPYLGLYR